jgi:prophage regulatory protein
MFIKILRLPDVEKIVGLSRSTIYSMIADGTFPKSVKLGKRAIGWPDHVIFDWIEKLSAGEKYHG